MSVIRVLQALGVAALVALGFACQSGSERRPARAVASAAELAASYGLAIRPPRAEGVPVRVVDAATGNAVADALVVSVDETDFTYSDAQDGGVTCNARSLLRESGEAYATAGDGVAFVAAHAEPRSLFVWHGDDFGRATLEVHDREEHLVAVGPRALLVEVVDEKGKPQQGIPIQIGKCALEPGSVGTTVGITGADGRLAIPPLELERGVHRSCGRRVMVMLGSMIGGYELRAIDAPRLEPVKFVLPERGDVVVELQTSHPWPPGADAAAWPRYGIFVQCTKRGEPRGPDRRREPISERWFTLPSDRVACRLENVEVGTMLSFRLEIQLNETSFTSEDLMVIGADGVASEETEGPSRTGEVKRITVDAGSLGAPPEEEADSAESQAEEVDDSNGTELEEELPETSSLEVSVLLDVEIEACWLSVRLDENQDPYDSQTCPWIDVNGRATARQLWRGEHSVAITARRLGHSNSDLPICEIDGIEVGRGQHLRDPRLQQIDLRGKLRVHRCEITDRDGRPLSGIIRLTRDAEPSFQDDVWFEDGHASFLTRADDDLRASVAVNGYRTRPVDLATREPAGPLRRIEMERGIEVVLRLDPALAMPEATRHKLFLGISEMPRWRESLDELRTVELRKDADLRFWLPEPGDWPVVFLREQQFGDREPTVLPCTSIESTLSVVDTPAGVIQPLTLKPDPDRWDALLRSFDD